MQAFAEESIFQNAKVRVKLAGIRIEVFLRERLRHFRRHANMLARLCVDVRAVAV